MTTKSDSEKEPEIRKEDAAEEAAPETSAETPDETGEEKSGQPVKKNPVKRLIWGSIYLAGFLFVIFTALANLGGSSDIFKETLEQYIGDTTPYSAKVGRLNALYFFPEIVIDAEGIELSSRKTQEPVIFINRVRLAIGFFDVMFKRQRYRMLELERLQAQPGSILEGALVLDRVGFREDGADKAFLGAVGNVSGKPFEIRMGFQPEGDPRHRRYLAAENMELKAVLGEAALAGILKADPQGDLVLEGFTLRQGGSEAAKGNFNIERLGSGRFSLKGRAEILPHKTVLKPDLAFHMGALPMEVRGNVSASPFNVQDFSGKAPLAQAAGIWTETFGAFEAALDLDLALENFTSGGIDWGTVRTKLVLDKGGLKIGPLNGKIMDGDLSGNVLLKSAASPMTLDAQIDVRNLNYALLEKQFDEKTKIEGKADLWIDLGARGENMQALAEALAGKIVLVGGRGRIGLDTVSRWGEGLPGILLQDLPKDAALDMTCAIADLDIKDGVARSSSIFADTAQTKIQGAGQYDFARDLLEMTVYSGKGAGQPSAAHVNGPLSDLKVSAGRFGASGSLAQAAVSPDFKPLSLPDRGLSADHPCRAFVIETEVLDAPVFGGKK